MCFDTNSFVGNILVYLSKLNEMKSPLFVLYVSTHIAFSLKLCTDYVCKVSWCVGNRVSTAKLYGTIVESCVSVVLTTIFCYVLLLSLDNS